MTTRKTKVLHTFTESALRKHSISFLDAMEVFRDPYAIAEQDRVVDGELRWRTIGMVDGLIVLFVAHTVVDEGEVETVRLISARKATRKERIRYGQNR